MKWKTGGWKGAEKRGKRLEEIEQERRERREKIGGEGMQGDQLIITQRLLCVLVSSLPGQGPFRKQLPQVS